jgi:hypothetical protein
MILYYIAEWEHALVAQGGCQDETHSKSSLSSLSVAIANLNMESSTVEERTNLLYDIILYDVYIYIYIYIYIVFYSMMLHIL